MTNLTTFWFENDRVWFNATREDDEMITNRFIDYIPETMFEAILYHDQILRHVARHFGVVYDRENTNIAVSYAKQLLISEYPPSQRVFILLPFRHLCTLESVTFAKDEILKLIETDGPLPIYLRFYRATITQLSEYGSIHRVECEKANEFPVRFTSLLCPSCSLVPNNSLEIDFSSLVFPDVLTLSLSGGVDSMVSLYLAKCIFKRDVIAIHINYGNRETANLEEEMIAWYCTKLEIPFNVRRITEITRTRDYNREFYEEITRKIRFSAYRELQRPVILGHNQTDCEENIIHNLKKRQNFSNLLGMRENSIIDGVRIIRPMLGVSKENMYRIAHRFGIPYFANSTPVWSERGIAREKILPQIPESVRSGLLALSTYISNIDAVFEEMVNSIEIREVGNTLVFETPLINEAVYGRIFSKRNIRISHKALAYAVSRFRNGKSNEKVRLNREYFITRKGNTHTITQN